MYGVWWSVLGLIFIAVALADALWTTLSMRGAGWLTDYVTAGAGRAAMKGPRWMAENAFLAALLTSFLTWGLLLWVGWTLFFCGSPDAVLDPNNSRPVDFSDRAYFTGVVLTTLGFGDRVPGNGVWQVGAVMGAASGFALLTLSLTYAASVITALNLRRSVGAAVGHLGPTAEDIVLLLRDGGAQPVSTRLLNLTGQLEMAAMQSDAFPVLEYLHTIPPDRSFAVAAVTLGEVTLLLEHVLDDEQTLPPAVWKPLRRAVDLILHEKHAGARAKGSVSPDLPNLDRLRQAGMAISAGAESAYRSAEVQQMRAQWAKWLWWHGRSWRELSE